MSYYRNLKTIIFLFIIYSFFIKTSSKVFSKSEMKKICAESEDYISSFFSHDQVLDEKYYNYEKNGDFQSKDKYIIQMLLLNEKALKIYKSQNLTKYNLCRVLIFILLILSIIIIFIVNIHFFYRLCGDKPGELEIDSRISFSNFYKIAPFAWVRYLFYGKDKKAEFYVSYKNQKNKTSKFLKIFFIVLIICLMIVSIILAIFNNKEFEKSENSTYNISCGIMKFLYEIKNGPFRKNNFVGLEKINTFFNEFESDSKNSVENLAKYDESFNGETKTLISEWDNYIINLNTELNNKDFYINSYPSSLNYTKGDIEKCSNCEKHSYQIKNIYDYFPSTDKSKSLYIINLFLHSNIDSIYNVINKINDISNQNIKINNSLYQNIFAASYNIVDIYIDKIATVYLPNFHNSFTKNAFSFLFNTDFSFLILLIMIFILFIPFLIYSCSKDFSDTKLFMVFLFFECVFCLLIISMLSSLKIICMQKKIKYIDDLSKAVYFLFDKDNLAYLEENNEGYEIGNTKYNITDKDGIDKNIIYYFNYIVNNNGNVSGLFDMSFENTRKNKMNELSEQLTKIINNKTNLMNKQLTNSYIENNSNNFLKIINYGLDANTNFKDINSDKMEYPSLYLSYINSFTRFKNEDYLNCDELWNISTSYFDKYVYKNKQDAINNNHYYRKDDSSTPVLLNYLEFTLDDILKRYSDLLSSKQEVYYGIINQFKALENFRKDNIIIKQLQKIYEYNEYLNSLESNIFELVKENVLLSKEITDSYINQYNLNLNGENNSYSFLDCDFIKKDLYFVLGEITISFKSTIENFCKKHLLINLINILLSALLIFYYSLISYEIPFTKKRILPGKKMATYYEPDNKKEIDGLKYKNATEEVEKEELKQQQKERNETVKYNNNYSVLQNSNVGGFLSIYHGGNTINNNNISPQINQMTGTNSNQIPGMNVNPASGTNLNRLNDVLNINNIMNPIQRSLSNLFSNNDINTGLPIINNEDDRRNNIDQSKDMMIEDTKKNNIDKLNK